MTKIRFSSTGPHPADCKLETEDGQVIDDVISVRFDVAPDNALVANIQLFLGSVDVIANPLLTFEVLETTAEAMGYKLVRRAK